MDANVKFTPLADFEDEELRSGYCSGLTYTIRPQDALLRRKVDGWLKEGKVKLGTESSQLPRVIAGEGGVK